MSLPSGQHSAIQPSSNAQRATPQPMWWSEFWLGALLLAAIVLTRRLFETWDYLFPMLLLGIGIYIFTAETRRQRWPLLVAVPTTAALAGLLCARLIYYDTLFAEIIPTTSTFQQMGADLSDSWFEFGFVIAPTEATNGFIFGAGIAAWLLAVSSDSLAFRFRSALLACVPAFVLLVFVGALANDDWASLSAGLVIFCAVLFAVTHRLAYSKVPWLRSNTPARRQARAPVRLALVLVGAAAVGAIVLTPVLPGVEGRALIALKELDGVTPAARVALNPLVDARGRLVETSNLELFRVKADAPAYWRVSGLGTFDGVVWGSDRSYSGATGRLREAEPGEPVLRQEVTISALDSVWLPAAFEPISFEGGDTLYDPQSATLVLRGGVELATGRTYTVESATALPDVEQLRAADDSVPEEIADNYMYLPDDFSPEIIGLAQEITADADSPFASALALQNFFLENFTYSLEAASGHGANRLQRFLFEDRSGYCEQFSGSYAAMARAVDLPARVAVGFTPGELVAGEYVVRGEHYHAWPEVWIGDRWVYFEPTPGRGAPGASAYTGVEAQQATPGDPDGTETPENQLPAEPLDGLTGGLTDFTGFVEEFGSGSASTTPDEFSWRLPLIVLLALMAAGLVWLVAVPVVFWLQRRQRLERARGNQQAEVHSRWLDMCETLQITGTRRFVGETHAEFAKRAAQSNSLNPAATGELARTMDYAYFAKHEPGLAESGTGLSGTAQVARLDELDETVDDLRRAVRNQSTIWQRLLHTYRLESRNSENLVEPS